MKKSVVLNTWAIFIYFFCQWLITVLITRMAGYEAAGQYSLAVSFANMFSFIGIYGVRGFQISDVNYHYKDQQYFVLRLITLSVAVILFAAVLVVKGYSQGTKYCCIAMMSYKVLEGIDDCIIGSMQRSGKYAWIALSYTLKGIAPLAACVICLRFEKTLPLMIVFMAVLYAAILILYDAPKFINLVRTKRKSYGNRITKIIRECSPLMLTSLLDSIIVYLPRSTIQRFLGTEMLGYYSTVAIIVVVLSTLGGGIWGGVVPKISAQIQSENWDVVVDDVKKILGLALGANVVILVAGALLGKFFFVLVFGAEIKNYMYLLVPVLINAIIMFFISFFQSVLIPLKKQTVVLYSNVATALICSIFLSAFVAKYGLIGACYGHMVGLLFRLCYLGMYVWISIYKERKEVHK